MKKVPIGQGNVELTISAEFPSEGYKKAFSMEVEESGLGEERVADKPLGARQPTRTPRGITRSNRHGFPPSFFVLLAPVTYLMNS